MPSRIKGTGIQIFLDWLETVTLAEQRERMFKNLAGQAKELAQGTILASSHYTYDLYVEILKATADYFGDKYDELAQSHGEYAADKLMRGVYRTSLKKGDVVATLRALAFGWRFYFDTGEILLHETKVGHFIFEIIDAHYHALHAPISAGYVKRGCQLAGGTNVRIQIRHETPAVKIDVFWDDRSGLNN